MSNNLANLMVGFGLDLSALQKDAPEAFRILNQQTLGMSAEMKRSSREGAESLRLIDEALGIHVSRPLTRILTQEFPAFGKALQSVLGVGVAGALGAIAFEAFEKITASIEKAQKAQKDFADSTIAVKNTFEDIMAGFAKDEKLHSLTGIDKKLFEIDSSVAQETRSKIDQLTKALEENAKAAAAAGGWWVRFKAAVGDGAEALFSSSNAANAAKLDQQLTQFHQKLTDLGRIDDLNQTHYGAAAISAELDAADRKLKQLQADEGKISRSVVGEGEGANVVSTLLASPEEVAAQERFIAAVKQFRDIENGAGADQGSKDADARAEAAIAARKKAIHDFQEEAKGWNEENNKAVEAWIKLNTELDKAIKKMNENVFKDMAARGKESGWLNPQVGPPPGAPALGDQETLMKISGQWQGEDATAQQTAAWKKAGQVLEEIETPAEKYAIALQTLVELQNQGRLTQGQVTAAIEKMDQALTKADLHVLKMQKDLEKLLEHSTSAADGVRAFYMQLEIESTQNGKMAFQLLTTGLKGFEDQLTKLVFDGKAKWKDLFRSMTEEAFKFMLNKDLAGLFKMIGGTSAGQSLEHALGLGPDLGKIAANPPMSLQTFGALMGRDTAGATTSTVAGTATTANTTALSANTNALLALAAKITVGGGGFGGGGFTFGGGAGGSGGGGDFLSSDIYGFASGTDNAPGGFAWVGEQGPELVNLPGGSSVTPAGSLRGAGDTHIHQDFRGAVVTDDLMRKADFVRSMRAMKPALIGEALANFSEVQKRTPGGR